MRALLLLLVCVSLHAGVKRSASEVATFKRENPCPSTGSTRGRCPGFVVDHVIALACGGLDYHRNMQWQSVEAAKEKDRWERDFCPKRKGL